MHVVFNCIFVAARVSEFILFLKHCFFFLLLLFVIQICLTAAAKNNPFLSHQRKERHRKLVVL